MVQVLKKGLFNENQNSCAIIVKRFFLGEVIMTCTYTPLMIIAGILFIFAIASWKYHDIVNREETLKKIRRVWYSFCVLAFAVYINIKPPKTAEGYNKLLVSQEVWDLLFFFAIFIFFAVVVDALILRVTSLGEFKFGGFGGKFLGEETKVNLKEQLNNIELIYDKIQAEHEVIQDLENYMAPLVDRLLVAENEDWLAEFEDFLKQYCQAQKSNIEVAVFNTRDETLAQIKDHFKLNSSKSRELKRNIADKQSTFCDKSSDTLNYGKDILLVPVESNYYGETVLVTLQGKNNVLDNEQFMVLNLMKLFEASVFNILKQIELEEQIPAS